MYQGSFQGPPTSPNAESTPNGLIDRQAGFADRFADITRRFGALSGLELVEATIHEAFPGRIALLSSFGTEAAVLLDMVARIDPATPVLFLDTGMLFGQTGAYREQLQARLGLSDVRAIRPDPARLAKSDPDRTLWQRDPDACCALRKVEPMRRGLERIGLDRPHDRSRESAPNIEDGAGPAPEGFDAWITGRKRHHGGARSELGNFDMDADGRIKINPLAGWSRDAIDGYFKARDLPRHPLADAGFASVGCYPCTQPSSDEKDPRGGRWAGSDKTECGIHSPFRNGF